MEDLFIVLKLVLFPESQTKRKEKGESDVSIADLESTIVNF